MRKLHLFSILVALSLATSSLWALPTGVVDGKLPGAFSVACGEYVYFSQGNLQYDSDNGRWQFAPEQHVYVGNTTGNTNITVNGKNDKTGIADLFCWVGASSSWNTGVKKYGLTSSQAYNQIDGYGNKADEGLKSDWGVLPIYNGGNAANSGWRTLTANEWDYLLNTNNDSNSGKYRQGNRYAKANVHGVNGLILLPDGWTQEGSGMSGTLSGINTQDAAYTAITNADWTALENDGCVFLPAAGKRQGVAVSDVEEKGNYWSCIGRNAVDAYKVDFSAGEVKRPNVNCSRAYGFSVRLVQDVPAGLAPAIPQASVATPPTAVANLVYNGSSKALVNCASGATGGTGKYKLSTSGSWITYSPYATNAGEYTVQWFVEASGCYLNSDVYEIHVTIARGTASAPSPMPTISAATSLTYNGTPQNLVTATGDIQSGYTTVYSTDGVNWSTTIPQGTNAGDYTVYYKFYQGDNYEYVPSPNTIDASIAKADIPGVTLPEATSTIPYDGAEKTLVEIDPVPANCTVSYSTDGGNTWTTTPPTRTDAGDYSVQYKIVPDDAVNYNTIGPNTVTVTILDYPTVYDNADPTTKLTELLNTPSDLKVKRTIYADDEYNTICLPFALDESALAASPLAGFNRLKTFKGAQVTGTAPDLYIDIFVEDATTIEAGIPYLITYPSAHADIVDPVFNGITVTTTEPSAVSVDGITFQGMFAQVHIDPYDAGHTQDYLFVGANSQLYWPLSTQTSSDIKMRGFRAYFIIDRNSISPALAPKGTRARIMDAPKTTTAIDNPSAKFGGSEKIIENGILYIIRNGVKYNAQGQVVK